MTVTTNVKQMKLNVVTQQQYDSMTKSANELYAVTDANISYKELSDKPAVTSLPTAASTNEGDIYQYVGVTDQYYTHGYFYECVSDGAVTPTYSWEQLDVQPAGSSLPSQIGNSGKFLTTNGTDASWTDKVLVNISTDTNKYGALFTWPGSGSAQPPSTTWYGTGCLWAGTLFEKPSRKASGSTGFGFGISTNDANCCVFGNSARATGIYSNCFGSSAYTNAVGAFQFGNGTNSEAGTVCFGLTTTGISGSWTNYKVLDSDGTIPEARLADITSATQGQVLSLDSNLNAVWTTPSSGGVSSTTVTLAVNDWSSNTQTVSATGVTASNNVIVAAAPTSQTDYTNAGILCTAQGAGTLTFTCTTVPSSAITVNVLIFN